MTRLALLTALLAAIAAGQQTSRDRADPAAPPAGTARLAGVVLDTAPDPQPVRRAILTLTGTELPRGRTAISDDDGRFTFEQLPAGRYMLAATKPAYLPGAYGASRPGRPGVPLQIADGQALSNLRIVMARGAAVTGTLRDISGEPAPNLQVVAFRMPVPGAAAQTVVPTGLSVTDDRGVYRVYGLTPGTYVVATVSRTSGRTPDVAVLPPSEIDQALRELQERAGLAATRATPSVDSAGLAPGTYDLAPVFYPGVPTPAAATTIRLGLGEERAGIDFPVQFTRMATIRGFVSYPPGEAPTIQFAIRTDGLRLPALTGSVPSFSSEAGPTGRAFTYTNAAPGRYVITTRTRSGEPLWARADVEIAGQDVSGLALTLRPMIRLRGRVVFEGNSRPIDASAIRLSIVAANGAGGGGSGYTQLGNLSVPAINVAADGRFEIADIIPETYRLTVTFPAASGWWLRSAVVNGRDVLDHLLEIEPAGDISGVVLTFSDRPTTLSGTLLTSAGAAAPAYFIAVFPADRALWRAESRRILSARSGTDGRWMVRELPPGDYLIAALTDLDPEDLASPAFLETLAASAVKVPIALGDQKTQDLRVGGS
jgi:uncharacterized protein (DUF2141 family)